MRHGMADDDEDFAHAHGIHGGEGVMTAIRAAHFEAIPAAFDLEVSGELTISADLGDLLPLLNFTP